MTRRRDERGVTIILFALFVVAAFVLVALVIDGGNARQARRQAQNSADAAALAGASQLYATGSPVFATAIAAVKDYSVSNFGVDKSTGWTGCTDANLPSGWYTPDPGNSCISFDSSTSPTKVRVRIPTRSVKTFFGGIAGINKMDVSASAVALVTPGGAAECGLCVIGSNNDPPYDSQNGDYTVTGDAGAAINGDATTKKNGNLTVTGGGIKLYRGGSASGNFSPSPTSQQGALADPLAFLTPPSTAGAVKTGCKGPGVYRSIPSCTLTTGVYIITGDTHFSGQTKIDATSGVTLYFTCGNSDGTARACASNNGLGENGADSLCTGKSAIDVVAPSSGPTKGMAIWFDRNNKASWGCRGNGVTNISGTFYGAMVTLDMRGNGTCNIDSLVVVGYVRNSGNPSACNIDYDKNRNVQLPPGLTQLIE